MLVFHTENFHKLIFSIQLINKYIKNPVSYFREANKTHTCIEIMTQDCNPIQRAPVSYVFGNVLFRDPKQCGIPHPPAPEVARDPLFQLSACASSYSMAVQRAYSTPPTKNLTLEMCAAAVVLDRCVYYTEVTSSAKVMAGNMGMLTKALMDVSCNRVPMSKL